MVPGVGRPIRVETRGKFVQSAGAIEVILHVVLAGELHFHRSARGLGTLDGFEDEVRHGAASEATPQHRDVDLDLIGLQTRDLLNGSHGPARGLGRRVDIATMRFHVRDAHHGFHGGVGEKRAVIAGVQLFCFAQSCGALTFLPHHLARSLDPFLETLPDVSG